MEAGEAQVTTYAMFAEAWTQLGREWWELMRTTPAMRQEVKDTIQGMAMKLEAARRKLLEMEAEEQKP